MYAGTYGKPMWDLDKPFDRHTYDESKEDHSSLHHFHSKLLKLKDTMNTKTAKKLAAHRHAVMEDFVKEFFDEWEGRR